MPQEDRIHELLFSPAALMLGEIHWRILHSANLIEAQRCKQARHGLVSRSEFTELGKEVGADEINWWVFRREKNVDELREQTKQALDAVQVLKVDSAKLKTVDPVSYTELLSSLKVFTEGRAAQITTLLEYVRWPLRGATSRRRYFLHIECGARRAGVIGG